MTCLVSKRQIINDNHVFLDTMKGDGISFSTSISNRKFVFKKRHIFIHHIDRKRSVLQSKMDFLILYESLKVSLSDSEVQKELSKQTLCLDHTS